MHASTNKSHSAVMSCVHLSQCSDDDAVVANRNLHWPVTMLIIMMILSMIIMVMITTFINEDDYDANDVDNYHGDDDNSNR